jgi:hypothetical protein
VGVSIGESEFENAFFYADRLVMVVQMVGAVITIQTLDSLFSPDELAALRPGS